MVTSSESILHTVTTVLFLSLSLTILIPSSDLNHTFTAYGQYDVSTFRKDVKAIDDMRALKVKVGDIDIAYKQLGNNTEKPIILIGGGATTMDMWNPILLRELSSSHLVIIFDNRGVGNTTLGTEDFSINQFAKDTAGLLDALNIPKADILGFSMGSFIAQELALKSANKVNNLILYGSGCGGKGSVPPSPEALEALEVFAKKSSPTQKDSDRMASTMFPPDWFKENPNYENYVPFPKESITPEMSQRQKDAILSWWSLGTCNALSKITQSTLVIVGTDDVWLPAANSLMIAEKIPGAWLVQIKNAGHGLMNQYPDKFSKVVSVFLDSERPNR